MNVVYKPVVNHGGNISGPIGIVVHVQEGNGSLYGWFNNPSSDASSHYWVAKSGVIEQYVDTKLQAWAQSAGNADYLSVETEGYVTEAFTSAQSASLKELLQWASTTFKFPFKMVNH